MKIPGKLILAGLALSVANMAFAAATFNDVKAAVDVNKDYRQAESLMKEVIANNPDNAEYHYVYSQILQHNGKHDGAVHELAEAKRIDPDTKFVKNRAHFKSYEASLGADNAGTVAPVGSNNNYAANATNNGPVQPYMPLSAIDQHIEHKSGHTLLWVVLILAVLGVAGFFFCRRVQDSDRRADEERMKAARQDQLKQATALLDSIKPLKLDIRMATPANPQLLVQVEDCERSLVNLIERLGSSPVAQSEIDTQTRSLDHLRRVFEGKPDPEPIAPAAQPQDYQTPGYQNSPYQNSPYQNSPYTNQTGFVQQPIGPVYQQVVPQTVYVENNNGLGVGGGLLAGMALGAMMEGGQEREVIREVHVVRDQDYVNDDIGNSQPDIDFGNDSGGSDDSW